MAQLERAQKAAALEAQIAELAALELGLITLHHEQFERAAPRQVPPPPAIDVAALSRQWEKEATKKISVFKRAARKQARIQAREAARAEAVRVNAANREQHNALQTAANVEWEQLNAHDPDTVITVLDSAFADNASEATCIDAGTDDGRHYATVVIVFGPASLIPERTPATTPTGKPTTKKRTKSDRNTLYVQALGSTVLATVKEAFAVAPSLDETRVLVLRRDPQAATPTEYLTAIYSAEFDRTRTQALAWTTIDPGEALYGADNARFQRKGAAGDIIRIDTTDDPDLHQLITTFTEALRTNITQQDQP